MSKIGLIARMDNTGLGNQTRNLAEMLNPDKVLLINSKSFNGNQQNPGWYSKYNVTEVDGFPTNTQAVKFLDGIDTLFTCELPYNWLLFSQARIKKVKTFLQYNYEFCDYLNRSGLPFPDVMVAPSPWKYKELEERFNGRTKFVHLPPPLDYSKFASNRLVNIEQRESKSRRYLHVVGRAAVHDRNGTETLLKALNFLKRTDIEVMLKSQAIIPKRILGLCRYKVTVDYSSPSDESELYKGFDAVIMPRKYGGLCLPMNEALASGLPVIMTDISPNSDVLPDAWRVPANKKGEFMARSNIDIYEADARKLAEAIDRITNLSSNDLSAEKTVAATIGYEYSQERLKPKYEELMK